MTTITGACFNRNTNTLFVSYNNGETKETAFRKPIITHMVSESPLQDAIDALRAQGVTLTDLTPQPVDPARRRPYARIQQ